MVGWYGSECHGVVINNSRCQPHAPIPRVCEGQSYVYQTMCVVARSASHLVLGCSANSGHCARHWERGMALGTMSLHSNHLTHAWWYTTLCAMSHHASFLLLNREWNSVAARNGCCVCGVNAFMFSPIAWANTCHNAFTNLHSKCTWSTVFLLPHLHLSVGCA